MGIPSILGPAAVLVLWSLVVLLWMTGTRFPAFAKAGVNVAKTPRGARYADVEKDMPAKVNWVSHNYTAGAGERCTDPHRAVHGVDHLPVGPGGQRSETDCVLRPAGLERAPRPDQA